MRKLIRQAMLSLGLLTGMAISAPALALEIEVLNETDLSVQVQGAAAVPSGTSAWVGPTARVTLAKPGGVVILEYQFVQTEEIWTGQTAACDYNVPSARFFVKLFERTRSTGAEQRLGQICAASEADTVGRLRFSLDSAGSYALSFESRSRNSGRVVGGISASLPALGKATGIASGLLGNGDYVFEYGTNQCLVNGANGYELVPVRFNWGGAGLCGLGAAAVYENKQAVITLRKVDAEHYVLRSAAWRLKTRGSVASGTQDTYEFTGQYCLRSLANGTVLRTNAGASDDLCHSLPDDFFRNRPELLWKIKRISGGTFITNSAYGGIEKCLMFPNNGHDLQPNLWNWGLGGEVCGLPGGSFDSKGQAGWKPSRLD